MPADPKVWSADDLERDRQTAIRAFIDDRLREPVGLYLDFFGEVQRAIDDLLEITLDLTLLRSGSEEQVRALLLEIVTDARLFEAFRYIAAPPISLDDLKTMAQVSSMSRKALKRDPASLDEIGEVVLASRDRQRFPWLDAGREPEGGEKEASVVATSALLATRRVETWRRNEVKRIQEAAVAEVLVQAGFAEVPTRKIPNLRQAPGPGEFCRESTLSGRKADLVVALHDGRTMPIECKVSNSAINSVKRLNNDAAVKAKAWREDLGSKQVVPVAVLSGVYKLHNLQDAQSRGLSLFWAHSLGELADWIEQTRN